MKQIVFKASENFRKDDWVSKTQFNPLMSGGNKKVTHA